MAKEIEYKFLTKNDVEVEVKDANTVFDKLDFIGADVTHDIRYINANLAMLPYSK